MKKLIPSLWLACAALVLLVPTAARAFDPEGKYELIQPPQPTDTPDKIEVVDIFWYGCPHCFQFLPVMEAYEKSKSQDVEIRRMPAIFRKNWEIHARAYYTAELLGITDTFHRALFEEIHLSHKKMDNKADLAKLFGKHGVAKGDFEKTFDSFAVESLVRKSMVMQGRYGIRGTPTVVVSGKYRTSGSIAGGYEDMIKVIEALAERERAAKIAAQ